MKNIQFQILTIKAKYEMFFNYLIELFQTLIERLLVHTSWQSQVRYGTHIKFYANNKPCILLL